MMPPRIFTALACVGLTIGARVKQSVQLHRSESEAKTTRSVPWAAGKVYICMQKYEKSTASFVNQYCLADFTKVMEAQLELDKRSSAAIIRVSTSISKCQSKGAPWTMKVCNLKGKVDARLQYSGKVHIPKSCFMKIVRTGTSTKGMSIPLLETSLGRDACLEQHGLPKAMQGVLGTQVISSAPVKPGRNKQDSLDFNGVEDPTVHEIDEDNVETTEDDEVTNSFLLDKLLDQEDEEDGGLNTPDDAEVDAEDEAVDGDRSEDATGDGDMDFKDLGIAQIRALWHKRVEEDVARGQTILPVPTQ